MDKIKIKYKENSTWLDRWDKFDNPKDPLDFVLDDKFELQELKKPNEQDGAVSCYIMIKKTKLGTKDEKNNFAPLTVEKMKIIVE